MITHQGLTRRHASRVSPYHSNLDYYRGKVKSVYEKEPCFKDFVRNIPLSESNVYDQNNLSRLKRRFQSLVSDRWGRDATPDPLKPSRVRIRNKLTSLSHIPKSQIQSSPV